MYPIALTKSLFLALLLPVFSLLAACGGSTPAETASVADGLSVDLQLPDSMTGGRLAQRMSSLQQLRPDDFAAGSGTGEPCAYVGVEDDQELFTNGYYTTRFLVATMAGWTCIADLLIDISDIVVHDGSIFETDNDTQATDYDPDDPTHYSVTDDSDTQTTVRLYYGFDRADPPTELDQPQFFISWNESSPVTTEGRLIIDAEAINGTDKPADDPIRMRMDFSFGADTKHADMFLQFDANNPWAEGMRIDIVKDLNANPLQQVFTARGLINMKGQFFESPGISELPAIRVFTVADQLGNGASLADVDDMSLPLVLNHNLNNHLGDYLFSKRDVYFFEHDMDWDYIDKSFTSAAYRGGRTTPVSGGTWLPFNPSQDMIIAALSLDPAYFTGALCGDIDSDCLDLFTAVFDDGFAEQEQNQGTDPLDWRSTALQSVMHLDSVYPNGQDWQGAFDHVFIP